MYLPRESKGGLASASKMGRERERGFTLVLMCGFPFVEFVILLSVLIGGFSFHYLLLLAGVGRGLRSGLVWSRGEVFSVYWGVFCISAAVCFSR